VYRLTNVFGKWCRPNYNSAVATFSHNIARGLPITVNDPSAALRLVYVDDVVESMIALLKEPWQVGGTIDVRPEYETTVEAVVNLLREFSDSRSTRLMPRVGTGFARALYATYVSYLAPGDFAYPLTRHTDPRGVFAEMLKTPDCGQFSFFSAHPGVTRGGHYHHTKTEKFLVVRGRARFGFRNVLTGEQQEILVSGEESRVVETVPGWVHDITNIGDEEMLVMLWANEVFDPGKPDTIASPVLL
jgi:UDP-2-acetamido-2,6-beta-L-arabino-hexul-4-ose reductase